MTMPLEGIRVLDFTAFIPGQYCGMLLADMGADVIKVERPGGLGAGLSPHMVRRVGATKSVDRNKRSIGMNLSNLEARKVFYKLAETADVVLEGFRPGVTKRLGVDYETLSKINPRIIYCAITGYGQDGPYRDLVGFDICYAATAGALSMIGQKDGPPAIPANLLGDMAGGGLHAAYGIVLAILARQKTGKGQFIDMAMVDGVISIMTQAFYIYFWDNHLPERGNDFDTGAMPDYNLYQCRDGKYLAVAALLPNFWADLCRAIGREDLIPHQAATGAKKEDVFRALRQAFLAKTRDEWFDLLTKTEASVAKVNDLEEATHDPQMRHRQMFFELEEPKKGKTRQVGIAVKLSETPGCVRSLAPEIGQHTDEIMAALGYSREEIARLRQAGVVI